MSNTLEFYNSNMVFDAVPAASTISARASANRAVLNMTMKMQLKISASSAMTDLTETEPAVRRTALICKRVAGDGGGSVCYLLAG
jgi:hypothetical protein